jgi:hypothetical protein
MIQQWYFPTYLHPPRTRQYPTGDGEAMDGLRYRSLQVVDPLLRMGTTV